VADSGFSPLTSAIRSKDFLVAATVGNVNAAARLLCLKGTPAINY